MISGIGVATDGVEAGSSGAGVEVEDASSDKDVITSRVEASSSGITVEEREASLNKVESVMNACTLNVGIAVVVAGGADAELRTGTVEVLHAAEDLALYASHLWW